mmetsp:Transcript_28217/g.59101  ORF Transcript_28217/g.59101 Transcript_28217/m.59101 type:complete len:146 (-) Transcript_28217:899-1336(-)
MRSSNFKLEDTADLNSPTEGTPKETAILKREHQKRRPTLRERTPEKTANPKRENTKRNGRPGKRIDRKRDQENDSVAYDSTPEETGRPEESRPEETDLFPKTRETTTIAIAILLQCHPWCHYHHQQQQRPCCCLGTNIATKKGNF